MKSLTAKGSNAKLCRVFCKPIKCIYTFLLIVCEIHREVGIIFFQSISTGLFCQFLLQMFELTYFYVFVHSKLIQSFYLTKNIFFLNLVWYSAITYNCQKTTLFKYRSVILYQKSIWNYWWLGKKKLIPMINANVMAKQKPNKIFFFSQ